VAQGPVQDAEIPEPAAETPGQGLKLRLPPGGQGGLLGSEPEWLSWFKVEASRLPRDRKKTGAAGFMEGRAGRPGLLEVFFTMT
jgi:hypothetical protein